MATTKGQETVKKIVTDRIIEQLEQGVIPWRKPWIGKGSAWNRRGKAYTMLNQLMLGEGGEYATFNQIKKEGGHVNKGAKASYVIEWFLREYDKTDKNGDPVLNDDGTPAKWRKWSMKYEKVFNIARDTDLKVKHENSKTFEGEPIELCEQVAAHYLTVQGIPLKCDNKDKAFYVPAKDYVNVPDLDQFANVEEYYSTLFHECAHSTGHKSRLDRIKEVAAFGSNDYGKEELVAELSSACLLSMLGIETDSSFQNSASYIDNWKKAIKGDNDLVISASTQADKAVEMIMDGAEI